MTEAQANQILELLQYLPAIWLSSKQLVFWVVTCVGIASGWLVADTLIDQANKGIVNY